MVQNLVSGHWEQILVRGSGPIELVVNSRTPARLTCVGSAGPVRHPRGEEHVVVLPPGSVGQRALTVIVESRDGGPFVGGATVDMSLDVRASGESLLFLNNPVAGQVSAPVVQMMLSDQGILVRPASRGAASTGLGGWCVRRLEESGYDVALAVSRICVDSSQSMTLYQRRVELLCRFVQEVAETLGVNAPEVTYVPVGGATAGGVGQIRPTDNEPNVLWLTDLPFDTAGRQLLVGDASVLQALPNTRASAVSAEAWALLESDDTAYDESTLRLIGPLLGCVRISKGASE